MNTPESHDFTHEPMLNEFAVEGCYEENIIHYRNKGCLVWLV